jgi:hypothetical protein
MSADYQPLKMMIAIPSGRVSSPMLDYHPVQSAIMDDIRSSSMNIVLLGQKSVSLYENHSHFMNIICFS